jgi:hypothetical protein
LEFRDSWLVIRDFVPGEQPERQHRVWHPQLSIVPGFAEQMISFTLVYARVFEM